MNELSKMADELTRRCAGHRRNLHIALGNRTFSYFPWFFLADVVIWTVIPAAVAWWWFR